MNFTTYELQMYKEALNEKVCSVCKQFGYEDLCGDREGQCIIEQHLPRILEAVLTVPESDKIVDYLPSLRAIVCDRCQHQDESGRCEMREHAYCTLDSFFTLVVQTIEESAGRNSTCPDEVDIVGATAG
jgi:hypothetical protein